jgi:hypothetical protein
MFVSSYVILIYGMHCLYSGPVVLSIYSPDDEDYLIMYVILLLFWCYFIDLFYIRVPMLLWILWNCKLMK